MAPALQLDPVLPPAQILATLSPPVRRLLALVESLYGGSCDACAEDVRRRLAQKPYLYRLDVPGIDILDWLHRLNTYEIARGERFAVALKHAEVCP